MNVASWRWVSAAVLALVLSGCGSADYQKRIDQQLKRVEYQAQFAPLSKQETSFGTLPIKVRLPKWFEEAPSKRKEVTTTSMLNANTMVNPSHYQPALCKLQGVQVCLQSLHPPTSANSTPYMIHLAAEKVGASDVSYLDDLRTQLRGAAGEDKEGIEWRDLDVPTIQEKTAKWKWIRARGEGAYTYFGYTDQTKVPVVVDLFLTEQDGFRIVIGFTIPQEFADQLDAQKAGRLVAGTLNVQLAPGALAVNQ